VGGMNLSEISDRDLHREQRRRRKLQKKRSRKAHGLPQRKKGMGCRIGDRDFAAMEARDFQDPSSYIRRDGSEKLVGKDWDARVDELRERSEGQCEELVEVWESSAGEYFVHRCSALAVDPQHKIKRSVRRDDRLRNLQHLCREHHDLKHPEFKTQWSKK